MLDDRHLWRIFLQHLFKGPALKSPAGVVEGIQIGGRGMHK